MTSPFDARPIIVAIAGPNGSGKSTFFDAHVAPAGLRFLNADDLARELNLEVELLPTGYDVDDATTLRRLCDELLSGKTTNDIAPNTQKFLAALMTQRKL